MAVRGIREMFGAEAALFRDICRALQDTAEDHGYAPYVPSALAEQSVLVDKAGREVLGQMYTFEDKGGRPLCLIPEVTALVQCAYKEGWAKTTRWPSFFGWRWTRRPTRGRFS
jgi:histidyl-tRNA synthetase